MDEQTVIFQGSDEGLSPIADRVQALPKGEMNIAEHFAPNSTSPKATRFQTISFGDEGRALNLRSKQFSKTIRTSLETKQAGVPCREFNTTERHETQLNRSKMRTYKKYDEDQRRIGLSSIQVKDFHYYNRKDNLWNEFSRLAPSIQKYSHENIDPKHTFKKTIRDLPKIKETEREEKKDLDLQKLLQLRQDQKQRTSNRKLERFVLQYHCSQGLSEDQIEEVQKLEQEDPNAFDELANRKKFTHLSKNTTKAIKDQNMNNAYWNLLNHIPAKKVKSIVTERVLQMDKHSCDNLLNAILDEKKQEDEKKRIVQQERQTARAKLISKHNQRIQLAERIGVKIIKRSPPSQLNDSMQHSSIQGFTDLQRMSDIKNSKQFGEYSFIQNNENSFFTRKETDNSVQTPREEKLKQTPRDETMRHTIGQNSLFQGETGPPSLQTRYTNPKKYETSNRINILSMPKPQYHGKDFFQRQEFRGLFLADHQEAIGERAFKCVDTLNQDTVSLFNSIGSFRDSISQKKTQQQYYKTNTIVKPFIRSTYSTNTKKASTSIPQQRRSRIGTNKSRLDQDSIDQQDTINDLFDTSRNNSVEQRRIQTQGGMGWAHGQHGRGGAGMEQMLKFNSQTPSEQASKFHLNTNPFHFSKQIFSEFVDRSLDRKVNDSTEMKKVSSSGNVDYVMKVPKALSIATKRLGVRSKNSAGRNTISLNTRLSTGVNSSHVNIKDFQY